ncbi:MAG TPA: MlaD family protein [Chlamydiales bacterium]|nr:MlaD family protein [Chlamydiales bacterium]
MTDQVKNILIGLFVTSALMIMVALVLFLKPTVGDGKKILSVRFTNIGGISVGTRVTFAGKPIGEVIHIRELSNARDEADETGRIYLYQLTLKIDSGATIYNTDEISIKTNGLMGERTVAIVPKLPAKDKMAQVVTTQVIYANSTDALENTFSQVTKVANRLETAVGKLDRWFDQNQQTLASAIKTFDGAMGQIDGLLGLVAAEKLVPAVRQSVDLLNDNMTLVRSSLDEDQLLHKYASLADSLDQATGVLNTDGAQILRNFSQISRDIASGTGTVGRLVAGDDFYLRMASLMNKTETLMNDINHYGILFQYNKQWQKTRTRKANFLKALDTPQEFRNYFEGEVDSMTTSLGRLTELMERANTTERDNIIQSDAFKSSFANLMRQVQGLTDSLRLYNENLVAESEIK